MIRHIVMFSCKDHTDVDAIYRGLSVLTQITHAAKVEIALNEKVDQIANDIDVIVYAEFESIEAFRAYKADPLYQVSIDRVRHLRDVRVAGDYTVANATTVALEAVETTGR